MHTLQTTKAFVLQKFPQGESNYTYKLFTHTLGLLYAHGQSVRELKSRNKYALSVGQLSEVTLVRGREVWRITGAQNSTDSPNVPEFKRRVLHTVGKLTPVEVVSPDLFTVVEQLFLYDCTEKETETLLEVLTMLRVMDRLGFVARPIQENVIREFLDLDSIDTDILEKVKTHKKKLIARVNNALEEAN